MKIKALELLSSDLPATAHFYEHILEIPMDSIKEERLGFSIGTTRIDFIKSDIGKPTYHFAIDIANNKLEEAYEFIRKKQPILPVSPQSNIADFSMWNAKSFYFLDVNGNILELISRFDLANKASQAFNPSCLQYVSEIGMVTKSVLKTAGEIMEHYPLQFYSKQPPLPNFCALGDENGLLILVNQKKCWYPTDRAATSYYSSVTFLGDDGKEYKITSNSNGPIV